MAPIRKPRNYRRVAQACSTCKRKKIRCPGEKPHCSHCVRLRQNCQYPEVTTTAYNGMERLRAKSSTDIYEEMFDPIQDSLDLPRSLPTPESAPPSIVVSNRPSYTQNQSLLPPHHVLERAIEIYFTCAHLQPLWILEQDTFLGQETCEELLLAVLAIGTQYDPSRFEEDKLLTPLAYNEAARSLIMSRITNASVDIPVLQALCLLSFFNLLSGQIALANFHTTLAKTLLQSSGLDSEVSQPAPHGRLTWSIFLIDSICGQHVKVPSFSDDFLNSARYAVAQGRLDGTLGRLPQLPEESHTYEGKDTSLRIWGYTVKISCLWREARLYIMRCAEGDITAPWKPDSSYTLILSHITDYESTYPTPYRYDSSSLVSADEVAGNPHFWWPWIRIQFMYHTIYCVLNHPFLYPATSSKTPLGPNGFWKTASQLALLHSTWIARLIAWAINKKLPLNEPFYAQSAVLAATLHAYWTRANDPTIKGAAKKHLDICRSFVEEMAGRWPICGETNELLNDFLRLTMTPETQTQITVEHSAAIENSMWKIFDCVIAQPERPGSGLFQQSYGGGRHTDLRSQPGQFNVEDPDVTSQANDIYNAGACNASQPDWFPPTATEAGHGRMRQRVGDVPATIASEQLTRTHALQASHQEHIMESAENPPLLFDWAGGVSGTTGFYDPNVRLPWQDNLSWALDFGNL